MTKKDPASRKRFYGTFVSLALYVSATDILERGDDLWQNFLKILIEDENFTPERYDQDEEPPRYVFEPSNLSPILKFLSTEGESILFERYNPHYLFYAIDTGSIVASGPDNSERISAEEVYFQQKENINSFLSLSIRLYSLFQPFYGRACHKDDMNMQNMIYTYFPPDHPNAGKVYSMTGFGGDTRKGIPGVYWANFFSKIYINTIGRGKFLTAPCYRREELSDGGFLLLTSESPLDWEKPEVQELRKAMRTHLGYEYFCDINNRDRTCKVPKFDFSVWEKECDYGMKIPARLQK